MMSSQPRRTNCLAFSVIAMEKISWSQVMVSDKLKARNLGELVAARLGEAEAKRDNCEE